MQDRSESHPDRGKRVRTGSAGESGVDYAVRVRYGVRSSPEIQGHPNQVNLLAQCPLERLDDGWRWLSN